MHKPTILHEGSYNKDDLEKFKKTHPDAKIIDLLNDQLKELFEIENPQLLFNSAKKLEEAKYLAKRERNDNLNGSWIYYPWNNTLLHTLNEIDLISLRTNRNRNLVILGEQQKLYDSTIAVAGMSIGSNILESLNYSAIGNAYRMADFDTLDTTNLNRIRFNLLDIGNPKIEVSAQKLYELNPYLTLNLYDKGLDDSTVETFVTATPKPDLIIEAIDDFKMKIMIRVHAKKAKIPVVMLTNLGDTVLIDVERFDKKSDTPVFNGLIGDVEKEILSKSDLTPEEINKYAVQVVGKENVPKRAMESLPEIGKTLVGRPQLIGTLSIASGIACYVARKIILGQEMESGRYKFVISNIF